MAYDTREVKEAVGDCLRQPSWEMLKARGCGKLLSTCPTPSPAHPPPHTSPKPRTLRTHIHTQHTTSCCLWHHTLTDCKAGQSLSPSASRPLQFYFVVPLIKRWSPADYPLTLTAHVTLLQSTGAEVVMQHFRTKASRGLAYFRPHSWSSVTPITPAIS